MVKLAQKETSFLKILLIIILGLFIYSNCLDGKFIWDDYGLIKENQYLKDWKSLPKIITGDFGVGSGVKSSFYRPLPMVIHMIEYSLWGLNVKGYHLTNVLLHIFTAITVFLFINLILYDKGISFLTSLLFLVHPINTQAVCCMSGINITASLLFILLCLVFYIKSLSSNNIALYCMALLSFSMGLLSKESVIVAPALILLYHYTFRKSIEIKKIVPLFIILICYLLIRLVVLNSFVGVSVSPYVLLQRIPGFFVAITEYLRLLLFPFDLRIAYGDKIFSINEPRVIAGVSVTFLLIVLAFVRKKKDPLTFFSIAWFFVTLIPVSNIYPINSSFMMEHWLYVPCVGFFLILSRMLRRHLNNKRAMFSLNVFAIILLAFYSYLTIRQNEYWKEPIAFYKRTIKYAPDGWIFYNELGNEYAGIMEYELAEDAYSKALGINPDAIGVYYNLAGLYQKTGRDKEAMQMFNKARAINYRIFNSCYESGNKNLSSGRYRESIIFYKKALGLSPDNLALYCDLAKSNIMIGNYSEAIRLLKNALVLNPDYPTAYNNLAVAYYYKKDYELAVTYCDKAIELGYKVSPKFLQLLKPYRK
ncbi:MAG: tetratricopeptide repeat protein [Candidatus Omnitrophota bacterium]